MNWSNDWVGDKPVEITTKVQADNGNYVTVTGEAVGDLLIYKGFEWDETGWKIAHIPTSTKFDSAVPSGLHTKQALIKWCTIIQDFCCREFEVLRLLTPETYDNEFVEFNGEQINVDDVKETLKGYCLGTKVES